MRLLQGVGLHLHAAIVLLMLAAGTPLFAQSMLPWRTMAWSESFTTASPPGRYFLGSATRVDPTAGHAVLTPDAESQAGRLFLREFHPISHFDLSFRGWFGTSSARNGGGADGIVAVFAPLYDYPESGGGALNFDGCLGYGIEFDTYQNDELGDRAPEHVAVIKDVSSNHLRSEVLGSPTLEDDAWHVLRIRFRAGSVEVFVDGQRRLDMQITDFYPFDGFFGFASATGFAFNEHRIDDIALSLPTRQSMDLGIVDICVESERDTAILLRNNHPDVLPLEITSVSLESTPPGAFTLGGNPAPATIAPGEDLRIPLRFQGTEAGDYSAVLRIDAANGETVFDTLRFTAGEPVLSWGRGMARFPETMIGDTSVILRTLYNTGQAAATITGLRWGRLSRNPFTMLLPLPVVLQPGDSLVVPLRFVPIDRMDSRDSLVLITQCGEAVALHVAGRGETGTYIFSAKPLLLLSPGETDRLVVRVDSVPEIWKGEFFEFTYTYDRLFVAFDGIEDIPDGPASNALLQLLYPGDMITIQCRVPGGLADTGAVFALRFTAVAQGPECRPFTMDWDSHFSYRVNGKLAARICINPSCRHPEGLYSSAAPTLAVSPQPARERFDVHVGAGIAQTAVLELYDARGRAVRRVFDGELPAQGGTFTTPTEGLSSGYYTLFLRCASGTRSLPVLVWK